ncbi:MAG TPA: hypothetical protein PLV25_05100 [Opitutales bacterium]|nr:hypothetical protein [Opitutales bacterium]
MRLVESIAPGAKLPQQPAWYLRQGQLETLDPVLASLEASVKSPKIEGDDIKAWRQTLPNLGRMIGAAAQVIPHIYQTQALHILLHLGEHPKLPDDLVTPLAEALYTIAKEPKQDHLEERHMDRAHRILKGLTPSPFAEPKKAKTTAPATSAAHQRSLPTKNKAKRALAHARN